MKKKHDLKKMLKKTWHFIWEDDSLLSWILNIVLAFVLIKFLVYPGLGFVFGTTHPIVAVVSGSMEHRTVPVCLQRDLYGSCINYADMSYEICGKEVDYKKNLGLREFYDICGSWYSDINISYSDFESFSLRNGFNKGDIMILYGRGDLVVGDVIVFQADRPDPIIHRIVSIDYVDGEKVFKTKGDHNEDSYYFESDIEQDELIGKAVFRIPFLGYVKIWAVDLVRFIASLVG